MVRAIQNRIDGNLKLDTPKISVWARRLLSEIQSGQRLCRTFMRVDDRHPGGVSYVLEPSGQRARPGAAEELIRGGYVSPLNDALFPEASSQTFEAVAK